MSNRREIKIKEKALAKENLAKKKATRKFLKEFIPLLIAVFLWLVTITFVYMLPSKYNVAYFFINFTIDSTVIIGKLLFIPVTSYSFPYITVDGFTMRVIMECTAYNIYIFVIYLSLLSPVSWKQKLFTLFIFLGAVFVVNNLRFIVMGYIGKYSANMFDYIHDYLWNILFGFMVFLIWVWRYNKSQDTDIEKK